MLSVIDIKYITHSFHTILPCVKNANTCEVFSHISWIILQRRRFYNRYRSFRGNGVKNKFHFKLTADIIFVGLISQEVLVCFAYCSWQN